MGRRQGCSGRRSHSPERWPAMTERPNLGEILTGIGRIGTPEVEQALEYQREHGGYFGEALVALGVVSQDELEWGLASQFDLPYIFPDPESVDAEAAALVTPEWALAHLAMPILRTGDTLTVVVESPIRTQAVEELARRTDRRIQLALAAGDRIRELIRKHYGRERAALEDERFTPVDFGHALALALEAAAARFGVSVRGPRAWFWYEDGDTRRRRPLHGSWESDMDALVSPSPSAEVAASDRSRFVAHVSRSGVVSPAEVECIATPGGREYLFRSTDDGNGPRNRFTPPEPGLAMEIRLLARSGSARFAVTADPGELGPLILPHLPRLLLDRSWREVHLAFDGGDEDDVFRVALSSTEEHRAEELEELRGFGFDVVTADLTGGGTAAMRAIFDVAGVSFVLWPPSDDRKTAYEAGIRWELHLTRLEGDRLDWSLLPLRP